MDRSRSGVGDERANARNIVYDFLEGVESIIAFENDRLRHLPPQEIFQQVEGLIGHWVGVGIGENWMPCNMLGHGDAARHVHLLHVTFLNLPTRLAKTLLRLTAGEEGSAPKHKLSITQQEISQIIGRSRESTNKQLRAWAKRGWVRLERGGVSVLAPRKLEAIAAEASELDSS